MNRRKNFQMLVGKCMQHFQNKSKKLVPEAAEVLRNLMDVEDNGNHSTTHLYLVKAGDISRTYCRHYQQKQVDKRRWCHFKADGGPPH